MDYTDFRSEAEREASKANAPWWDGVDPEAARALAAARALLEASRPRHQANLVHARLYTNFDLVGFGSRDYSRALISSGLATPTARSRIGYNVIGSVIEALSSKIGKMRPRPSYLTDGGSWKQQQRARRLTQFMHGWFHESDIYRRCIHVRLDAYIFGTGAAHVHVDPRTKKVCVERQFIDELYVDDVDGKYGKPTQLFRRKIIDRSVLHERYPDKHAIIEKSQKPADETSLNMTSQLMDPVEVWECWRLGSGKQAGVHFVFTSAGLLRREDWRLRCFPFVFRRYRPRPLGFWGTGIAEILTPIQVEMNRALRSISEQLRRKGRGRIYAPLNSVDINQVNNQFGAVVFYKGAVPPTVDNSPAVSPDEVNHVRQLKADAFEEVGLSQLSATSKKPSGLDAAVAMREYNDIETERFALDAQADEAMYMDIAELALDLIREFVPDYEVAIPSKRYTKAVRWGDIRLKKGEYLGLMFPVSSLPSTPGARLQRVEELRMGQYIDLPTARKLLDFPDLEAEMTLANAAIEDADATISYILDDDKPRRLPVEPFQNVPLLVERATAAYLYARHHGAEEERLQMLRDLIADATARMAAVAASTMPAQPAAPGAAPALAPQGAEPPPAPGPALPPPVAP